jgi:GxxExxY protein
MGKYDQTNIDKLTEQVIGAAIEVHKHLGPGLLESAYEDCLAYELSTRGISFKKQVESPVTYKQVRIDCGYRIDMVVEDALVLELKAVEAVQPVHKAQILTYMRLSGLRYGLLINFNVPLLKSGIQRFVQG